MFTFVTETLGEPWDLDRWLVTGDDYLQERKADYDFGDAWPLEKTRFLAADRQARGGEHYFWVARAFGPGGASRLIGYGRCNTTSELEEVRRQLNVPVVNAMIDTGFKASEVYRFCLATGWKAMKGDDAEWFLAQDPRTGKTVRRVWRRVLVDPRLGAAKGRHRRRLLPLFRWSNPSLKDHLALFTHGVVGQWTLPRKVGRDYLDQMTAEVREEREDSRGRIKVLWSRNDGITATHERAMFWRESASATHGGQCLAAVADRRSGGAAGRHAAGAAGAVGCGPDDLQRQEGTRGLWHRRGWPTLLPRGLSAARFLTPFGGTPAVRFSLGVRRLFRE
ncbi:MAG: phage terminase large subunit family protein [Verrucomicrobia bacterium]|nr:phage terminase large subunit family protein [Verrucomicrobiota bacterium]